MAGVAFAVEGDGVGFATESYAASALYTTLASLSGALWRIRRASGRRVLTLTRPTASTMIYIARRPWSEVGHFRPKWAARVTSALPPIATELRTSPEVRFVPTPEIIRRKKKRRGRSRPIRRGCVRCRLGSTSRRATISQSLSALCCQSPRPRRSQKNYAHLPPGPLLGELGQPAAFQIVSKIGLRARQ